MQEISHSFAVQGIIPYKFLQQTYANPTYGKQMSLWSGRV